MDLNQRQARAEGEGRVTGVLEEGAFSQWRGRTLEHSLHFRAHGFKLAHLPADISFYPLLALQTIIWLWPLFSQSLLALFYVRKYNAV